MVKVEPFSLHVEFTAFVRPASSTDGIYPWTLAVDRPHTRDAGRGGAIVQERKGLGCSDGRRSFTVNIQACRRLNGMYDASYDYSVHSVMNST